ncbi:MAG: hypothetical protein PHI35_08660 [Victivallaceae bacterium]|nr:hypothetical protein [Victivallaceae bacterium]
MSHPKKNRNHGAAAVFIEFIASTLALAAGLLVAFRPVLAVEYIGWSFWCFFAAAAMLPIMFHRRGRARYELAWSGVMLFIGAATSYFAHPGGRTVLSILLWFSLAGVFFIVSAVRDRESWFFRAIDGLAGVWLIGFAAAAVWKRLDFQLAAPIFALNFIAIAMLGYGRLLAIWKDCSR